MNYENLKRRQMRGRRCQSMEWSFIIKNCGCQKLMYCVLFCVLGVFHLFAGLYLIFALQSN